ncbi:hypothetical protein [Leptospira stimsonii]|uniref:Uncharacterized protein n=1 Tax=Leptospira stimsonii TaxID=2202203 RepID=A0A396YNK4_9LEPT|nr:hypothetical protein [Leptospira stimsonii]RHX84749.1 hypothetical protein DLM75_22310 [Leptospira stimsonii]
MSFNIQKGAKDMKKIIFVSFIFLITFQFCRENSAGDASSKSQNVSEISENAKKKIEILNISDKRLVGFYGLSGTEWHEIVAMESKYPYLKLAHANAEMNGKDKALFFKFYNYKEDYPEIYRIDFKEAENEAEYYAEYNGKRIYKVLFVSQFRGGTSSHIYVKFFKIDEMKLAPDLFDGLVARASKIGDPYPIHVKTYKTLIDVEMDDRIGACFEEPSPEGREWPNCKPPGYNNLK